MTNLTTHYAQHISMPIKVWVLAPYLDAYDENINYYYDFSQSISEYHKTFSELNLEWKWQPVTLENYVSVINEIKKERKAQKYLPVIFNICDGDEINNTPGISIVKMLAKEGLIFTGADAFFYETTTSKITMKKAFDKAKIPTPRWEPIYYKDQQLKNVFKKLGNPIILKPSVSGGSMGITTKSVVCNLKDLKVQIDQLHKGYRGWNLSGDGLLAESYISGPEYTSFIVGSYDDPAKAIIYEPLQRVFHHSLPEREQFLSFDRLWEIYEDEAPMPQEENFYEYSTPDPEMIDEIKRLSWDAFVAVKGTGYTRVDLRQDKSTGKVYVIEVNAQCGISDDENFTSIGAILKESGKTFTQLVKDIIENAILKSKLVSEKSN